MTELTARELLVMLYEAALDAVDGRYLVNQWCRQNTGDESKHFTHCIAIGKASVAMLQGALDNNPSIRKSLLISPASKITRQIRKNKAITVVSSSHPIPGEKSLEAGRILIDFVSGMNEEDKVLFLISGGTSSLVEVPIEGISLEQLQHINKYLLASGKDIQQMNAWRKRFSKIKGGGLLDYMRTRSVTQLLLSDVKDDKIDIIGSGLLVDSMSEVEPDAYLSSFHRDGESYKRKSSIQPETIVIGNIELAKQAVYETARDEGLTCNIHDEFIEGDAVNVAGQLFERLKDLPPGITVFGGETTVCLPETPGIGGRNQTLALSFAQQLVDDPSLHLLAAGTDGVDGNSNCAGAVVSQNTLTTAMKMGIDIDVEIAKANAGLVLMATGDLIDGSSSNTNVMDIIIAYRC